MLTAIAVGFQLGGSGLIDSAMNLLDQWRNGKPLSSLVVIIGWDIFITLYYVACQLLCVSFDRLLPN